MWVGFQLMFQFRPSFELRFAVWVQARDARKRFSCTIVKRELLLEDGPTCEADCRGSRNSHRYQQFAKRGSNQYASNPLQDEYEERQCNECPEHHFIAVASVSWNVTHGGSATAFSTADASA